MRGSAPFAVASQRRGDQVEQPHDVASGQRLRPARQPRVALGVTRSSSGTSPSICTTSSSRAWTSRSREELAGVAARVGQRARRRAAPRAGSPAATASTRLEQQLGVGHAEHGEHVLERDLLVAGVGDELLERAERVAEAAGRVAGDQRDAPRRRSSICSCAATRAQHASRSARPSGGRSRSGGSGRRPSAAPSAPRSWRARRSCAAAAPRASSGTRSTPPARACAPRRGCRPCGGPTTGA